jgi:hypothetical protein
MVGYFNELIIHLLDTFAPIDTITINNKSSDFVFSDNLQKLANHRDYLYAQWGESKSLDHRNEFKRARNLTNSSLDKERRKHDEVKFNPSLPPKILFKRLREDGIVNNKLNDNPAFSPDEFNKYFESNFCDDTSDKFTFPPNFDGFSFKNVDAYDIFEAIKCIHSNACGADNSPIRFINLLLPVVMPFIVYIINTCITKSRFPSKWKMSKVFPCPKIPKPSNVSNFHPISILPSISKVFEIVLKDQIVNYLNSSNLLTGFQSGFRKHFSTTSALLNITDVITSNIDDGKLL